MGAGETAQWLRALAAFPEFNSQRLHVGSQPSIVRSVVLLWHAGIYTERTFIPTKNSLKIDKVTCLLL